MMKIQIFLIAILTLGFLGQASAQSKPMAKSVSMETPMDIVGVAASNKDFSTLVTAVKTADLVSTLQGEGPFTVFAPTNEAFAKLPEGTVEGLLKPESKKQLQTILTYHVIAGKLMASDVVAAINAGGGKAKVETVSGGSLTAMLKDGSVWLKDENGNKSKIVLTDIAASNGVIHVIDAVVLPK